MKKLILLLLITTSLYAQMSVREFKARVDSVTKANRERIETGKTYNWTATTPTFTKRVTWLDEFLELYSEYERECKPDTIGVMYLPMGLYSQHIPMIMRVKTFQGFIEFLRKRGK